MAKENPSSRIPQLNGVSRIPAPGFIRPPTTFRNRTSQISRPSDATKQRTTTTTTTNIAVAPHTINFTTNLRAPAFGPNVIKKSTSGDRLNNAALSVSKKTTTALKKLFVRPEKATADVVQNMVTSTPYPLTRSDTFTRSDSQLDIQNIQQDILAQSTPATTNRLPAKIAKYEATSPFSSKDGAPSFESRRLLQFNETMTYGTKEQPIKLSPLAEMKNTFKIGETKVLFGRNEDGPSTASKTLILDDKTFESRQTVAQSEVLHGNNNNNNNKIMNISKGIEMEVNACVSNPNLTKFLQPGNQCLGNTVCMNSPSDLEKPHVEPENALDLNSTLILDKFSDINVTQTINASPFGDDICSPILNATFSNPDFADNLQLLEDISIPSGFDQDVTLQTDLTVKNLIEFSKNQDLNATLQALPSDKTSMKLPLNLMLSNERLLDLSASYGALPAKHLQLLNLTKDFTNSPSCVANLKNTSQFLYMTQLSSAKSTPDRNTKFAAVNSKMNQHTPLPTQLLSPMLLKGAQSDLVLPTRTPDDELLGEPMDVDTTVHAFGSRTGNFLAKLKQQQPGSAAISLQDVNNPKKGRFSFGLDLTESTLDCSIELVDDSYSSTVLSQPHTSQTGGQSISLLPSPSMQQMQNQLSFDLDESLGILTPDQMKEFLDSTHTNTNNLELPIILNTNAGNNNKLSIHQMRMDQTPSPEELPLDPVEVKTDISDVLMLHHQQTNQQNQRQLFQQQHMQSSANSTEPVSLHTDTEHSKTDQMTKSNVSKISTSFITSVTSVTSLDTGYQGDGEMSRPASRGACDHSPSNGPTARKSGHVSRQPSFNQQQQMLPPIRRQDPMTDSDFFTESDADDIFHRGDRRAQVIDGQLYGPMQAAATSVFITEDPQMEDSCMESSGIFTDVDNRGDEDLAQTRRQDTQNLMDMSPENEVDADDSTETVKSKHNRSLQKSETTTNATATALLGQGQMSSSQTSSTIQSSLSTDRFSGATTLSNRTSYCSVDGSNSAVSVEENGEKINNTNTSTNSVGSARSKSSTTGSLSPTTTTQPFQPTTQNNSVKATTSPRKHASLTSLCNNNNNNNNNANGNGNGNNAKINNTPIRANAGTILRSNSSSVPARPKTSTPKIKLKNKLAGSNVSLNNSGALSNKNSIELLENASPKIVRKPHAPNKWDAVMNKIASNKALIKKSYNDVKSKVSTRINVGSGSVVGGSGSGGGSARRSPTNVGVSATNNDRKSSASLALTVNVHNKNSMPPDQTATDLNINSKQIPAATALVLTPQTKRLLGSIGNSGRSYSKDSQKSSQSDLSVTCSGGRSGSPKLLAKTPIRAAKKRDVRNLSISPTDLGPPPKAQQPVNGTTARQKLAAPQLTQKRFGSNNVQAVANSPIPSTPSTGTSSPTQQKKHGNGIITKRPEVKLGTATTTTNNKAPAKDHGRLIGSQATANQQQILTATPSSKNKSETSTELQQELKNVVHHPQNIKNNNNNTLTTRTLSTTSPKNGRKITSSTATTNNSQSNEEKKSQIKSSRKLQLQQQQNSTEVAPITPASEYLDAAELQQLKLLNRHSCNGRLDYESIERHLQQAERLKEQQDKGVVAMGVLLQYLVNDLEAFACPSYKNQAIEAKESLNKTLKLLDDSKSVCTNFQEQLCEKEAYYNRREEELQTLHRCELEKFQAQTTELQQLARDQTTAFQTQLSAKEIQHQQMFDDYRQEMENKLAQKDAELQAAGERERILQERLSGLELSEKSSNERLVAAAKTEEELIERVKSLTKEMEILCEKKARVERELRDRLDLTQDEIAVLRTSQKGLNDSLESVNSLRNSTNSANEASLEAYSLRCVLEIKQEKLSALTKENEALQRKSDELNALHTKISLLESKNEMLKSELDIKTDKEKEYMRQIDEIQKAFKHETTKRMRLSFDKEALQWQLKQRSEMLQHLAHELSARDNSTVENGLYRSLNRSYLVNGSSLMQMDDDISPPTSPIIKGVIEKPDAVSWVLEMDDETPESAASKMVKRAGSFRSVDRFPTARRQLSTNSNTGGSTSLKVLNHSYSTGPNPLSQSMSAASVIRQHSSETSPADTNKRTHSRIRSKSMSVKDGEANNPKSKKIARQLSNNGRKSEMAPNLWIEPMSASSPYNAIRPRTSTIKVQEDERECQNEALFHRASANKNLITCDTSALNSGEILELHSLPSLPSMHDLKKVPKKCHEVQEAAGEAMVSGTNSEDEGCSASSDEIVSSSSGATGSNLSLNQMKNSNMSLEEVLLLNKIQSLNGTPMEVSWSDDVEHITDHSNV